MSRSCFLLGLDGGTFRIIDFCIQKGVMPFLKGFLESSAFGPIESTIPALTPPAWTTLATGRSPGHHGIFDFYTFESESTRMLRLISSRDISCETVWSMANRAGLRTAVLNYVATYPPPEINGYIVPGWVPWRWMKFGSRPRGLFKDIGRQKDINTKILAYHPDEEAKAIEGCEQEELEPWITLHIERENQWFQLARYLYEKDPSELTAVVLDGMDKIQHLCWRYIDPELSSGTPDKKFSHIRKLSFEYYRNVDRYIESLVKLAGPETTFIIASDHGFAPSDYQFSINVWLEEEGYLSWKDGDTQKRGRSESLQINDPASVTLKALNWDLTRAYAASPGTNGIFIPVSGSRGDKGILPQNYDSTRNDLIKKLKKAKNPWNNLPLISHVWKKEEVFSGPFLDKAPDLTFELFDKGHASISRNKSSLIRRPHTIGGHERPGIFALRGPGIVKGRHLDNISLLNVTPTILYSLNLPVPEDLEGDIVREAYSQQWIRQNPPQKGPQTERQLRSGTAVKETDILNNEEKEQIKKRLKTLGYFE